MEYKTIDLASYKRRDHFAYFNTLAYPYVGVTSNVEISGLLEKIKREGLPFFLTVCYWRPTACRSCASGLWMGALWSLRGAAPPIR